MNKNFKIIAATVLVICIGLPYGISYFLKLKYYDFIGQLNNKFPKVEFSGEFNNGWLTSTAKTKINFKANNPVHFTLELEHTIKNGPIIVDLKNNIVKTARLAAIDTKISSEPFVALSKAAYTDKDGLEITTDVNYRGALITKIKSLPFIKKTSNGQIEWGGVDAKIDHDLAVSYLNSEISIPKTSYKEFENLLTLQEIKFTGEQQIAISGLWEGTIDFNIKHLGVISGVKDIISVSGFKSSLTMPNDSTGVHVIKISATEISLPGGKLVLDARLKIGDKNIKQINKAELLKTMDAAVKIEMSKALTYEIAAKKIEHDLTLEAKAFDLSHEGQKMPSPYNLAPEGKKAEIEKRVLAEITKLVAEKFIIEKDKAFTTEIIIKNGITTINGQEFQVNF